MTQHLLGIWLYYDFNKAPVRLRAVPIFLLEFVEPRKKKSRKPARGERKNKQEKEEKKNINLSCFFSPQFPRTGLCKFFFLKKRET